MADRYMEAKAELAGIESQVLALAQEQDTISMSGVSILLLQLDADNMTHMKNMTPACRDYGNSHICIVKHSKVSGCQSACWNDIAN